ncbi:MAG: hypothetical protein WBA12_06520 [Catalinimonas sp.]
MLRYLLALLIFCGSLTTLRAQSTDPADPSSVRSPNQQSEIFQVESATTKKKKKRKRGSYQKMLAEKQKASEQNKKRVLKRRRKEAKMAQKPQYARFENFGHKREPKKRKQGKKKYCKQCGINH